MKMTKDTQCVKVRVREMKQSYCCTGTSVPPPVFSMNWREGAREEHTPQRIVKKTNNNNEKEKLEKRTTRVTSDHNTLAF